MTETYRNWEIHAAFLGYDAFHPSWGEPGDSGHVWGRTLDEVRSEIDDREDEG